MDEKTSDYSGIVPAGMLEAGERIIFAGRPQKFYFFFRPVTVSLILLAGGIAILTSTPVKWAGAVLISAAVIFFLIHFLRWQKTVYGFTNRRLFKHRGIIAKDIYETPLSRIQDIRITIGISQRLTGCGDIFITTAGTEDTACIWKDIFRPQMVKNRLSAQIDQANRPTI
ncbi:MAG: PH domain-containing protein [Candidatus Omnitrophota bacterium]